MTMTVRVEIEEWRMAEPLRITSHTFDVMPFLYVTIEKDGHVGRGEAAGVYYRGDDAASMKRQIAPLIPAIEAGITRNSLQGMLPPGGARNALDCALWDLEAKLSGRPVWQLAGLEQPRPLVTTFTCGADSPERMAVVARRHASAQALKLKLTGDPIDADRVRAVRETRPDVWLGADGNQGFTRASLERLMPVLVAARTALIEQPFPAGQDSLLDDFHSPIPVAADESAQALTDVAGLVGRFDVVNVKLDKCGGLTEALEMVRAARRLGLETMVGNMFGTSLAMAPSFLVGQLCTVVDLDGPAFLASDRPVSVNYTDGRIHCPEALWGYPESPAECL